MRYLKLFTIIGTLLVSHLGFAGTDSHGGGGVYKDGRYQTFYSAGFYTEKDENTIAEIPQLEELMTFIEGSKVDRKIRASLLLNMVPTQTRRYFSVNKDYFSDETRERLLNEYKRATGAPIDELQIYAITDTNNNITYLLPEFYLLSSLEQKVILYHEATWVMYPRFSYEKIISMEMAFQAYLENPGSLEATLAWQYSLGDRSGALSSIAQIDIENGNLSGFLTEDKYIKFSDLLSENYILCISGGDTGSSINGFEAPSCVGFVKLNVYRLRQQYPQSQFLRLFENLIESNPNFIVFRDTWRGDGSASSGLSNPNFWSMRELKRYLTLNGYIDLEAIADGETRMPVQLLRGTQKPRHIKHAEVVMSFREIIL